jgi:hypothetical protein
MLDDEEGALVAPSSLPSRRICSKRFPVHGYAYLLCSIDDTFLFSLRFQTTRGTVLLAKTPSVDRLSLFEYITKLWENTMHV